MKMQEIKMDKDFSISITKEEGGVLVVVKTNENFTENHPDIKIDFLRVKDGSTNSIYSSILRSELIKEHGQGWARLDNVSTDISTFNVIVSLVIKDQIITVQPSFKVSEGYTEL